MIINKRNLLIFIPSAYTRKFKVNVVFNEKFKKDASSLLINGSEEDKKSFYAKYGELCYDGWMCAGGEMKITSTSSSSSEMDFHSLLSHSMKGASTYFKASASYGGVSVGGGFSTSNSNEVLG